MIGMCRATAACTCLVMNGFRAERGEFFTVVEALLLTGRPHHNFQLNFKPFPRARADDFFPRGKGEFCTIVAAPPHQKFQLIFSPSPRARVDDLFIDWGAPLTGQASPPSLAMRCAPLQHTYKRPAQEQSTFTISTCFENVRTSMVGCIHHQRLKQPRRSAWSLH